MRRYFHFEELGINYRKEVLGGVIAFLAMADIIVVNPATLSNAGIPRDASITATILAAIIGIVPWSLVLFGISLLLFIFYPYQKV